MMPMKRMATVDRIKIDSVILSSVFQIGDSQHIEGRSNALAVQREAEIFFGTEGEYSSYPIFSEPIAFQPEMETIIYHTHTIHPFLKVRNIDITGVSSSSIVHLGNTCNVLLESRVKHIRHLLPRTKIQQ